MKIPTTLIRKLIFVAFLFLIITGLSSCGDDYTPKPRGYPRIDLPEEEYRQLDTVFPYTFEYPVYSKIEPDELSPDEKYWINIIYPRFHAKVHISYKKIDGNLIKYLEDSRTMVVKHIPKASAIHEELVVRPGEDVFGLVYEIEGLGAASPYQFFLTDSTTHFLRGALYFNVKPNNDSLQPVINLIRDDLNHLVNTLSWKKPSE